MKAHNPLYTEQFTITQLEEKHTHAKSCMCERMHVHVC